MSDSARPSGLGFSGRATLIEYVRWAREYQEDFNKGNSDFVFTDFHREWAERQFTLFSQSVYLVENFFNLDEVFKRAVEYFLGNEFPLCNIEAFVRLALEMQSFGIVLELDKYTEMGTVSFAIDEVLSLDPRVNDPVVFNHLVYDYEESHSVILAMHIVKMLAIVTTSSVVLMVLQRWKEAAYCGDLVGFIAVVRGWENWKNYPIDWAVSIARCENVE